MDIRDTEARPEPAVPRAPLAAAVVHDVKNRLVLLGAELAALERLPLEAEAAAHVRRAREQSARLTQRLVAYLTVQAASERHGLRAVPQPEVPAALLEALRSDAAGLRPNLQIVLEAEGAPPVWLFDRHLVGLALDSALHNALRFAASRITLGCRIEGQHLCFSVHDDGPGVQCEPGAASTGLGRWLCEEIARSHKNHGRLGRSTLRNHADGGAVFELFLP